MCVRVNNVSQGEGEHDEISEDINHFSDTQALSVQGWTSTCTGLAHQWPNLLQAQVGLKMHQLVETLTRKMQLKLCSIHLGELQVHVGSHILYFQNNLPQGLLGGAGMTESERGIFLDNIYVADVKLNQN